MSARVRDVFVFDLQPALAAVPVTIDQPVECEIQLCRTGSFYRADMGHFKVTRSTLERMVSNALERGLDLSVNYHHYGGDPNRPEEERKAAGWVSPASLTIRGYKGGYGLFGVARWTAAAAARIKAEELRYISPEIVWSDVRLAATDAGPAGEPIGASLVGAALTNDPFFNLNPVVFWRSATGRRAPKRYTMLTEAGKTKIKELLSAAGIGADVLEGLAAQLVLAVIEDYKAAEMAPPEVVVEEEMAAAQPEAAAAVQGDAAQALAASREGQQALARRVAQLEAEAAARQQTEAQQLFERYRAEGRYRVYATPGTDPDGSKKAKEHLAKGLSFFRSVFDAVPPLVGSRAPQVEGALPGVGRATPGRQAALGGEDAGAALHARVLAEIKAKGLSMAEYNKLADKFSRQ
jgi:phage I-like protein